MAHGSVSRSSSAGRFFAGHAESCRLCEYQHQTLNPHKTTPTFCITLKTHAKTGHTQDNAKLRKTLPAGLIAKLAG